MKLLIFAAVTRYEDKKAHYSRFLTLYGRKPVREALAAADVTPVRLHLADSNRDSAELSQMIALANERGAEIRHHTRESLSRISRNRRQDQGVALDIETEGYQPLSELVSAPPTRQLLFADHITNPQNLGMMIRSVAGSPLDGLVIPREGNARIDALVIKASAGALFHAHIYHCDTVSAGLSSLHDAGYRLMGLDAGGTRTLAEVPPAPGQVFVLGNETTGLSDATRALLDDVVSIPLSAGVESLNVAIAASLVAFRGMFQRE